MYIYLCSIRWTMDEVMIGPPWVHSSRRIAGVVGVHGGLDVRRVPSELLRDGGDPLLLPLGIADGGGERVDEGHLGGHAPVRHHAGVSPHQELHHVPAHAAVHLRLDVVA